MYGKLTFPAMMPYGAKLSRTRRRIKKQPPRIERMILGGKSRRKELKNNEGKMEVVTVAVGLTDY